MTSETKFTPGPWVVDDSLNINGQQRRHVCSAAGVSSSIDYEKVQLENKSNAHLISTAPDLYAALELHYIYKNTTPDSGGIDGPRHKSYCRFIEARDAALAKARGGQP